MSRSCGGACCRRFILPFSPQELEDQYRAWIVGPRNGSTHEVMRKSVRVENPLDEHVAPRMSYVDPEIFLLYPMLVYLGECNFEPYRPRKKTHVKTHHYTCKHYDKKTTLCTIYEHRPLMCRRYPNGHSCPFPSCVLPGNVKQRKLEKRRAESLDTVALKE